MFSKAPTLARRPSTAHFEITRLPQKGRNLASEYDLLWVSLFVGLVLILALPIFTYPITTDQSTFMLIANSIVKGGAPYVNGWDIKPPGIFYAYAPFVALFGTNTTALRVMDLTLVAVMALLVYGLGARLSTPRVGLWAVLLFVVLYFREIFWTLAQNDGVQMLPMTLAVFAALKTGDCLPGSPRALRFAALCGACCAVVFWFKYPFALFAMALALAHVMRRTGRTPFNLIAREALAFCFGVFVVIVGVLAYLAAIGAFSEWVRHVHATLEFPKGGGTPLDIFYRILRRFIRQMLVWFWLIPPLAAWVFYTVRGSSRLNREWYLILLPMVGTLCAIIMQGKGFEYHWLPLVPGMVLLGADGIHRTLIRVSKRWSAAKYLRLATGLTAVLLWLLAARTWGPSLQYVAGNQEEAEYLLTNFEFGRRYSAEESERVGEYLKAHTRPGDTLFIWGFRPEVYVMTGLQPATRFIMHYPLAATWSQPEWQEEALQTLQAAPPPYILVMSDDAIPSVLGSEHDSLTLLQQPGDLTDWLRANYAPETQIDTFGVWKYTGN